MTRCKARHLSINSLRGANERNLQQIINSVMNKTKATKREPYLEKILHFGAYKKYCHQVLINPRVPTIKCLLHIVKRFLQSAYMGLSPCNSIEKSALKFYNHESREIRVFDHQLSTKLNLQAIDDHLGILSIEHSAD